MRNRLEEYVVKQHKQGYPNGIPDQADDRLEALGKVPSYRRICRAIFKNDIHLTELGYARPKCDAYMAIKKVEIEERNRERV